MIKVLFTFLILIVLAIFPGCSKDKKQVDQLEKEAMEIQADADSAVIPAAEIVPETADTAELSIRNVADSATPISQNKPPMDELSVRQNEPADSGGYTIQIGSGINMADADRMAKLYIERGYEAFVTEVYIDNVSHYRVRIGNYDTYEKAATVGKELKDKYSLDYWIDSNI